MDRTAVSRDWHKQMLEDAALRDMPLHALRHTAAAAAWLAAGNSLMYVQRQLGHADIRRTSAPPSATTVIWSARSGCRAALEEPLLAACGRSGIP
ncbi:MAG TPA: hypothetical protein VFR48_00570 [Solirubrobacteraceae bacterium]|nr:hypothetical protein [Solirubrobacteraceae bacterium]